MKFLTRMCSVLRWRRDAAIRSDLLIFKGADSCAADGRGQATVSSSRQIVIQATTATERDADASAIEENRRQR